MAAEYVVREGNAQVILCERGIKTFETSTRFTLDIGAIPVLKQETHLPVIVDPSHAAGRRDLVLPLARAAVAAGADGIIVEVHPRAGARAVRRRAADPGRGLPALRRRDPRARVAHGQSRRVKSRARRRRSSGDVAVPGDKSISHRALLFGAIARGRERRPRLRPRRRHASRRSPRCARSASRCSRTTSTTCACAASGCAGCARRPSRSTAATRAR